MKNTFYKKHIKPILTNILILFALGATLYGNLHNLFDTNSESYQEFLDDSPDYRDEYENARRW
jgi:hypothetical protein